MIKLENQNILKLIFDSLIRFHIKQLIDKVNNTTLNITSLSMLNFKDIFKSMYFESENQTYDTYCKSLFEFQRKDNLELIKINKIDNERNHRGPNSAI
jgi:hypothetical protein